MIVFSRGGLVGAKQSLIIKIQYVMKCVTEPGHLWLLWTDMRSGTSCDICESRQQSIQTRPKDSNNKKCGLGRVNLLGIERKTNRTEP